MGLNLSIITSVNISAIQLQQTNFAERLATLLAAHSDVKPQYLELEVLETSALHNVEHVSEIMNACIGLGLNFALDDFAIVEGVIGVAKSFKREVIAEGVKTIEHGTALLQLGCELAQGNCIARPMPASDVLPWINDWKPDVSWQA